MSSGDLLFASTGLLLFGAPNTLLLGNLLSGNSQQVTFWRKFVLYEETILAGSMLTATLVGFLNSNEDIYPEGQRVEKEERFLFTEREILVLQLEVVALLGLSALIDLIPFSVENRPEVAFNIPSESFSNSIPEMRKFGLKLVWPI